jgi:hypothetical protein
MAKAKVGARQTRTGPESKASPGRRINQISKASTQIVKEAAALLDEEMAAGMLAAKKMQQRFQKDRRIDPSDFAEALHRFQSDGHEVVNLLNDQIAELRSDENAALMMRFTNNAHDLLDLVVGLVNMGAETANQLVEANLPKPGGEKNRRDR